LQVVCLLAFLWPSLFVFSLMVPTINLLLDFCVPYPYLPVLGFKKRECSQYS
jgi:hypothetical protein